VPSPTACTCRKPAGGGLLVPEDLRQRHALHGPNPTNDAAHASYAKLKKSADGSFDMYFGPTAPSVQEANWVETVPGRAFYLMYRLYSPTAPLFDGTWALPDAGLT
jgi:hypothetical protein